MNKITALQKKKNRGGTNYSEDRWWMGVDGEAQYESGAPTYSVKTQPALRIADYRQNSSPVSHELCVVSTVLINSSKSNALL